jgi:hypothetical protein
VRREVFLAVGDFAGIAIAEDVDWGRRAFAAGQRIDYLPAMAVATPARGSFAELTRKWGRHIGHDFAALGPGKAPRLRWLARSLALGLSPLGELPLTLTSPRVKGLRARLLAFACLTRIRLWRARTMLALLVTGDAARLSAAWRG